MSGGRERSVAAGREDEVSRAEHRRGVVGVPSFGCAARPRVDAAEPGGPGPGAVGAAAATGQDVEDLRGSSK